MTETSDRATADTDTDPKAGKGLEPIHTMALEHANEAWLLEEQNITEGRDDQKFYVGDQWDDAAKRARKDRAMLTINRLPTTVRQLTGDVRQNTPAIKVLPARDATQKQADIRNGLIRNIEVNSDADACYAMATENAAIAGQGAFRVNKEYSSDDGFEQDIRIRPIRDPFGVLIDPMATLPDKSDMRFAFVFERMSVESFKKKYPGKSVDNFPTPLAQGFAWKTGDTVRIAEYWCKKPRNKTLWLLDDTSVVDSKEDLAKAKEAGRTVKSTREVESYDVVQYVMNGKEILSGPNPWEGRYIPICFVPGEEVTIDGNTRRKGMVRDAKDPQRLYNYARTAAAESIALQPKAPFLVTPAMIAGYEETWKEAGLKNFPYLPYTPDKMAPLAKPERSQPAMGQQGLDSQALISAADMEAVTGIFKANLGAPSNETSGKAILARQREGDTGTYLYPDNLARAVRYCGVIINDLLPRIYDTERVVRILKEDGSHDMTTINQQVPVPGKLGEYALANDMTAGEYDIVVSTGPNYATKRAEAADAMLTLTRDMPIVGQVAPDLIVKALDMPYANDIAERLKKTLPPGLTEEGPAQEPQPDPVAQAKAGKDIASAMKDGATTDKIVAETTALNLTNAQTAIQLQTLGGDLQQLIAMVKQLAEGGQGGAPGGPPPEMQQPAGPMPGEGAPPEMAMMNGADSDMPPMAELDQPGAPQ